MLKKIIKFIPLILITFLFFTIKANAEEKLNEKFDFNFSDFVCENSKEPLKISTYVDKDNSVVHPSVLYFENGWNGYKYWMAVTPYTDTDSQYENPSIMVSNDKINWFIPGGLQNPIVNQPENGFNSDVNLFMDKNNNKLYCIWREVNASNFIKIMSTTNGVDWSDEKTIINCIKRDCASPSIIYDNGKYKLFAVDLYKDRTNKIDVYESNSPEGNWKYKEQITIPNIPSNMQLWHLELRKHKNQYILLYTISPVGYYGGDGGLYIAKSNDLRTWTTSDKPIINPGIWDKSFYKSSFIIQEENGQDLFNLWYGTTNYIDESNSSWDIGYTKKVINNNEIVNDDNNNKIVLAIDKFDRDDNTNSLGIADSGQEWLNLLGKIGISNNAAYNSNEENYINSISVMDVGKNNYDVSIKVDSIDEEQWIVVRAEDEYNFVRAGYAYNSLVIQNVINGETEDLYYDYYPLKNGDVIKVSCNNQDIKLLVNEINIADVSENRYINSSKVGLQLPEIESRIDYFLVEYKKER